MQLSKDVDLKIIHALKPFVSRELRGLEAWKALHGHLTENVREIRRISPKMLKMHVMKTLIFDIKRNRYKLPQQDVEVLCYPFLATLVGLKLMILDNHRYPTIAPEKLERQRIYIKYLLSRTRFNRELWNLVHTLAEEHPAEYHYINVNNPQYKLSDKERAYLRRFACKSVSEKTSARTNGIAVSTNKWLGKRRSRRSSEVPECIVLNGMIPQQTSSDAPLMNNPILEPKSPQSNSSKDSVTDAPNDSMNEATQIITGLAFAEDLVIKKADEDYGFTPSNDECGVIRVSSGSETEQVTFGLPYSFYEDTSDSTDFDEDVVNVT